MVMRMHYYVNTIFYSIGYEVRGDIVLQVAHGRDHRPLNVYIRVGYPSR